SDSHSGREGHLRVRQDSLRRTRKRDVEAPVAMPARERASATRARHHRVGVGPHEKVKNAVTATDNLRIGTSGGNYPPGNGTWNGVFYPPARGRAKTFDELSFYAEHFDTVEVNSTFYGQPRAEVCRAWAERTPPGFEFSLKLYQKFTHPAMFKKTLARKLPEGTDDDELMTALARPNDADLAEF